MSSVTIQLKTSRQFGNLGNLTNSSKDANNVAKVAANLVERWAAGVDSGELQVSISSADTVAAVASVAITHGSLVANDTLKIGRQTITAKASGAVAGTEFNIGANATADATNLAAAINANTTLTKYFVASTPVAGTVTVTARLKGAWANLLFSQSSSVGMVVTDFASGTGGFDSAPVTYVK